MQNVPLPAEAPATVPELYAVMINQFAAMNQRFDEQQVRSNHHQTQIGGVTAQLGGLVVTVGGLQEQLGGALAELHGANGPNAVAQLHRENQRVRKINSLLPTNAKFLLPYRLINNQLQEPPVLTHVPFTLHQFYRFSDQQLHLWLTWYELPWTNNTTTAVLRQRLQRHIGFV